MKILIALEVPDGIGVSVTQVDGVAAAHQVFGDDLEELGPIPTPPNEPQAFRGAATQQPTMPAGPQFPPFGSSPMCPVHRQPWKTVPAGVSKRTGQPYDSFRSCPVKDCKERP